MNSGKQAQELFKSLSTSQRRFLIEKDYTDEKTLEDWVSFLKEIVQYDILIDKITKNLKMAILSLWVIAIFNGLVAILTQSVPLGVGAGLMIILAIYQRFRRASYFKKDIHNHLRLFFYPLLIHLRENIGEKTPILAAFQLREKDKVESILSFSFRWGGDKSAKVKVLDEHYELKVLHGGREKEVTSENLSIEAFRKDLLAE